MQGARFESGLDNSPMYDGEFFDNATSLMQLVDVGMSSMVVQEAEALAELAAVVDRSADAARPSAPSGAPELNGGAQCAQPCMQPACAVQ